MNRTRRMTAGLLLVVMMITLLAGCAEAKDLMKPFRGMEKSATDYVELGQYLRIEAERIEVQQVTQELMDQYRNQMLYSYAEFTQVERAAQDGDKVVASYVGYIDGEAFEGGEAVSEEIILGMDEYIPGFEEGIVGMQIGETKHVDVVFPEDYWSAEFAGKEAYFDITLEQVYAAELPTYDDAFVQEYLRFESVEEFEEYMRDSWQIQFNDEAETEQLQAVWTVVRENCTILEYPEDEVEAYIADYTDYYTSMASYAGQDLDTYLQENYAITEEEFIEEVTDWAYEEIGDMLIIQAIIVAEEMELSDAEYEEAKTMLMEQMGYTSEEEFEADYESSFEAYYGEENIILAVLQEEVYQLVLDNAVLS